MTDYPQRLHHHTPGWVKAGALFHIRIRAAADRHFDLIDKAVASPLLDSAKKYHLRGDWWCVLFLLMPDHLHALLKFPADPGMSTTIRNWKRGATRLQKVEWQDNYFDYRLRSKKEAQEKWRYIRRNPVVKGLCAKEDDWPYWWSASDEAR